MEVTVTGGTARQRKNKPTVCAWCPNQPEIPDKFRRHMLYHHLPWYMDPQLACWHHRETFGQLGVLLNRHRGVDGCQRGYFGDPELTLWLTLITNLLSHVATHLGVVDTYELLSLVRRNRWHPDPSNGTIVSDVTVLLWQDLERFMGDQKSETYPVDPPNSIPALLHISVFEKLMSHLPIDVAAGIRTYEDSTIHYNPDFLRLEYRGPLADSHCHLVTTLWKLRVTSLQGLERVAIDHFGGTQREIPFLVANAAHPECWNRLADIAGNGVVYTYGMHPLVVTEGRRLLSEGALRTLLSHVKVRGVGECGFDTSRCRTDEEAQRTLKGQEGAFRMQLRLAHELQLVVVIHLRGRNPQETTTLQHRAMAIMSVILTKKHAVHVHCFAGDYDSYLAWVRRFPRAMFGFTSKVAQPGFSDVVHQIYPPKLLLETDAPYLTPRAIQQQFPRAVNSPYYLRENLISLGRAVNLPIRILGPLVTRNCVALYRIGVQGDPSNPDTWITV